MTFDLFHQLLYLSSSQKDSSAFLQKLEHMTRTGLCLTSDFFQESSSCFRHAPFCLSSVLRFLPFAGNIQLIFSLYTIYNKCHTVFLLRMALVYKYSLF